MLFAYETIGSPSGLDFLFALMATALGGFVAYRLMINYAVNVWKFKRYTDDCNHAIGWPTAGLALFEFVIGMVLGAHFRLWVPTVWFLMSPLVVVAIVLAIHGCVLAVAALINTVNALVSGNKTS